MMNKRLLDSLISVSATSSSAKELAGKVLAENGSDLVKELYAKIQDLELQLSSMKQIVEIPELTYEDAEHVSRYFGSHLASLPWEKVVFYNRACIKTFPIEVRVIVSNLLCARAVELKQAPLDEWLDIIALRGEIK